MTNVQKNALKEILLTGVVNMGYELEDENRKVTEDVLRFTATVFEQNEESIEQLRAAIKGAEILRTFEEIRFLEALKNQGTAEVRIALSIKKEILRSFEIKDLKEFDPDMMLDEVNTRAANGEIHAIRLQAILAWTGEYAKQDRALALRDWEMLAVNGDEFSMRALEYAYRELDNAEKSVFWKTVRELTEKRNDTMRPNYEPSASIDKKALEMSDLISCIQERPLRHGYTNHDPRRIDIHLSDYVLNTGDDLITKMENICGNNNFSLITVRARLNRGTNRTIGFMAG
ncbi:MAG: hypothetical protein IKB34_04110 [Clostridia bacterium]|nr:hypothetical protein [Clostridia bacterium]